MTSNMNFTYLNFVFFATSTYLKKLQNNFIILRVKGRAKSNNDIFHSRQFVSHPFLVFNSFLTTPPLIDNFS